jgi:hypothetical protein
MLLSRNLLPEGTQQRWLTGQLTHLPEAPVFFVAQATQQEWHTLTGALPLSLRLGAHRYRDVGKPIMISHMVGIAIRITFIAVCVGWRCFKLSRRKAALTQAQLNHAYMVGVAE